MPQQPTKSRKNQKEKLSKIPFICIVILLIAAVITICMVIKNNMSKEEQGGETAKQQSKQEQRNDTSEEEVPDQNAPLPEQSLIDMNNTQNAKVENGTKENTSTKLAEPKTYKGLTIKDIKLIAEGGVTRLTATVENNSSQDYNGEGIVVIFTNEDGSEYARLNGILPSIKAGGEPNELDAATTADLANAYNFTIQAQQ